MRLEVIDLQTYYVKKTNIVDNLTTDDTLKPLSAKQGKKLQDTKLNKSQGLGNANKNIITDSNGDITVCELNANIPTKISELTNDSGFITSENLPTKVSELTNDFGFITNSSLPTKISDLTNDSGFITDSSLPTKTSDLTNDSGFITDSTLPTKTSDLTNDSGFITLSDINEVDLENYATNDSIIEAIDYLTNELIR